ncbi:B-box zinc finger family protein [Trichomonas vaginalis G3]|uniref:B-box zinc finger family protein n=1 Tax=Trichomonas vaginalis (strain ATCC PRA-98 / G3) TaxID=412133 RepID=A2DDV6_TRIV3|nr:zinc ion binding [Trichomonas vaginalis G3]EAY21482.1 B-box zinc finger family protein [Trichomonas vaginalis G3]KAI5490695.1 zinc ion binding [Trichomonas vaginalis G3]|eukprot:XP_001582468.1 B-box zinc finger family protein [Trichomonas vaginalis G3]
MSLSLPPLPPESEAFRVIQYELQQQLDAVRVRIIEAFDITSITQSQLFAQYCQKINPVNVIHAFIPLSELDQPISDIAARGVRVNPKRGLKFRADHVVIDKAAKVGEVVHCLVALGNVQNYMDMTADYETKEFIKTPPTCDNLNQDYNSLCVSADHQYVICNADQIRTLQFIRFTAGELLENAPEINDICDLCQKNKSVVWCSNCNAHLCADCDRQSHEGNRLLQSHQRIPIEEAKPMMETCPFHPGVRVEHFCPTCQLPVCIECKMSGFHSKGPATSHTLIPLKDAYAAAIKAGYNESKVYIRRRHILREKMQDADRRYADVIANAKSLEARIMKIAQEAIASLHEQVAERTLIIQSTKTEIQRKLDEVDAKSNFVKEHLEYSSPLSVIRALTIHDKLINELRPDNDLPRPLAVEGDLALTGVLEVKSKQETIMPMGVRNRDVYFDERNVRNVDFPSTTFDGMNSSTFDSTQTTTQQQENSRMKSRNIGNTYSSTQNQTQTTGTFNTAAFNEVKMDVDPNMKSLIRIITLTQMALRHEQKLASKGIKLNFVPFEGTTILPNDEIARRLYMSLPFKTQPATHLLYSTERDPRTIRAIHDLIDNIGITVVLVKKGGYVFGGFAATKWNCDGQPFGDKSSSFLFSINRDIFIPYRPTIDDPCYLYATKDVLTFGKYDLVLAGDFNMCSAQIEKSYGIGLQPGSKEARLFFLPEKEFAADCVEVWGFFTSE